MRPTAGLCHGTPAGSVVPLRCCSDIRRSMDCNHAPTVAGAVFWSAADATVAFNPITAIAGKDAPDQ